MPVVISSHKKIEGGRIIPGKGWVSKADYDRVLAGEVTVAGKGGTEDPTSQFYKGPKETDIEGRLGEVEKAGQGIADAGAEDIAGQEGVNQSNKDRADAIALGMRTGQDVATGKFDAADTAAQTGLEDVQGQIDTTRDQVNKMPEKVKGEFDRHGAKLDASLNAARTGLSGMRTEALASVVQGQGAAMDAAVAGIHSATRQQISDIDSQIQQGTLSPSQGQAMKAQIRMGGAMQLSTAVGQTIHMFKETEAQVATSFGNMFTQFEGQAAATLGQFGAAAGGAFAQSQTAAAQFNTQLTNISSQAVANRDTILSQNASARAAAQNANDTVNMSMLDYTADLWVQRTPVAINNYTVANDLFSSWVKTDQGQQMLDNMRQSQKTADMMGGLNFVSSLVQAFL